MADIDYTQWVGNKIDELMSVEEQEEGKYDAEIIREYLIYMQSESRGNKIKEFFRHKLNDDTLLTALLDILLDESEDYSNDARYCAAEVISWFPTDILKRYKRELLVSQKYTLVNLRPFAEPPHWLSE